MNQQANPLLVGTVLNAYRIVKDAIDRNKNMDIIIDLLKEYNIT